MSVAQSVSSMEGSSDSVTTTAVLSCENLSMVYRQGPQEVPVLQDVSLSIQKGERVAIVGASGSGKSTLLNLLGGLDLPCKGQVFIAGQALAKLDDNQRGWLRNQSLGFVYQFHHLLAEFTALENVCMPLLIGKVSVAEARRIATGLLEKVGLGARLDHKPAELSGGERQRVAVARALATSPACVLMDEPTGNLDSHTAESIHQLLNELNHELETSFVIVTHDTSLANKMDRVLHLQDGRLSNGRTITDPEADTDAGSDYVTGGKA